MKFNTSTKPLYYLFSLFLLLSQRLLADDGSNPSAASTTTAKAATEPLVINPGPNDGPPPDSIVLFNGKALSKWRTEKGQDAK